MSSFLQRQRLSAYLDGALSVALQEEVEQALACDPELEDDYRAMCEAVERFRDCARAPAPPAMVEQVLSAHRGAPTRTSWGSFVGRAMLAVLVLAGIFAAGAALVGDSPTDAKATANDLAALHAEIASETPAAVASAQTSNTPEVVAAPTLEDVLAQGGSGSAIEVSSDGVVTVGLGGSAPPAVVDDEVSPEAWKPQPDSTGRLPSLTPDLSRGIEPFRADWEWAGSLTPSLVYRLSPKPAATDVLFLLDGLAEANGGELTNGAGLNLEPWTLEPGAYLSVRVKLPSEKLIAFIEELERQEIGEIREATTFPEFLPDGELDVDFEIHMP